MPAKRELTMRQLRYMLRLHHDGLSAREIGRTSGVARSTREVRVIGGDPFGARVTKPCSRASWKRLCRGHATLAP
jgi:hypothetical protein